ncbi:hypothetical protein BDP27DRAFT_1366054 [Rhodocollybia butyracea]|uniref:Uncharacterized protein n=1 Tax=Rhodocollybia butyracea TaxID=206335 RepID=A0A9P5PI88_9AGAR|nr:hypothetical protein BDP27DRAFT_1366054 [Rhodocollybia butyracea]
MPKSPSITASNNRINPIRLEQRQQCNQALFNELLTLQGQVDLPSHIPKPQVPPGRRVLSWRLYAGNPDKVTGPQHDRFDDLGRQYCEIVDSKTGEHICTNWEMQVIPRHILLSSQTLLDLLRRRAILFDAEQYLSSNTTPSRASFLTSRAPGPRVTNDDPADPAPPATVVDDDAKVQPAPATGSDEVEIWFSKSKHSSKIMKAESNQNASSRGSDKPDSGKGNDRRDQPIRKALASNNVQVNLRS